MIPEPIISVADLLSDDWATVRIAWWVIVGLLAFTVLRLI
jgi:hypothetical protein